MAAPKNWHSVFEKGSKQLQNRLKEIHKNNPEFHQFLKDRGETLSAKQAQGAKKRETPAAAPTAAKPKGSAERVSNIAAAAQKIRMRKAAASNRQSFGGELGGGFSTNMGFRKYSEETDKTDRTRKIAAAAQKIRSRKEAENSRKPLDLMPGDPSILSHIDNFRKYSEETEKIDELNRNTLVNYMNKVSADSQKHSKDPTKRSSKKANRSVAGYAKAFNKIKQIKENLSKACWSGYEAIGMKKKGGKWVPNCVPVKEERVDEMDSQGYKGHRGDEDPGKGPDKYVKPVQADKTSKDALKLLKKSFAKKQTIANSKNPIKEQTAGSSILNPDPKKGGKPKKYPGHGINMPKLKKEESDKPTKPKSKLEKAIDKYKGKKNKINVEPVANSLQPHQLGSHQISGGQDTEQHS